MAIISRRKIKILYLKLVKQSGSPESISRGVAIGFFIGFLVPVGGQMVLATILAFIFKARKIPALACTWITNPWSVPFIYPIQCFLGAKILGINLTLASITKLFENFFKERSLTAFQALGSEIIVPFFIGGTCLGVLFAFSAYFASYGMIIRHREKVEEKLLKRLAFIANKEKENREINI